MEITRRIDDAAVHTVQSRQSISRHQHLATVLNYLDGYRSRLVSILHHLYRHESSLQLRPQTDIDRERLRRGDHPMIGR